MRLRPDVRRQWVGLVLSLTLGGGPDVPLQSPASEAKHRACGRVLSIGCGASSTDPVTVTLDLGEFAVLLVDTSRIQKQEVLRQLGEGQALCFAGTLSRKASASELAMFDAVAYSYVQPSDVQKPFAIDAVTTCEPGVTMPKVIREQRPDYPREAMQVKLQGTVRLEVVVERDGRVAKVRVIRSLDRQFGLDDEAVAAAKKWRFAPATKDGRPVRSVVSIDMSFRLK